MQNQNLTKDLARLENTISFLEDQLHLASEDGLTEKTKILLGLGANVDAKDGNQGHPSTKSHPRAIQKLQKSYFKMELKLMH